MSIDLNNISFYSHPPTKPSPSATPASCWRPYQAPIAPYTIPFIPPSAQIQVPMRGTSNAGSEFDVEIGRAMRQNSLAMHDVDHDMHFDSGFQSGTETPRSEHPSLAHDRSDGSPSGEALGDLDNTPLPAEAQLHHKEVPISSPVSSTVAPSDLLKWRRDSVLSLGAYDETGPGPSLSEVSSTCLRVSPPPLDLPAQPSMASTYQEESNVDDTESRPESRLHRMEVAEGEMTTQNVQVNGPSRSSEACPDKNFRVDLTEERQTPASPRSTPRTRQVKQSEVPLASTRCLRPRPNAKSGRSKRLRAVSVVVPARRSDDYAVGANTNPLAKARSCGRGGGNDRNKNRRKQAMTEEYSLLSNKSCPQSRERPQKRPKTPTRNTLASTKDTIGKLTGHSLTSLDGGSAPTQDETQEIFGRGILRVQAHGPRQVYFMTFLPEVSHHPSVVSSTESSLHDKFSKNISSKPGVHKGYRKRPLSPACDGGDAWSSRPSTSSALSSRSRNGRRNTQPKTSRRMPWSSEEKQFLVELKRDRGRPWSEVTRRFLGKYPGRKPGTIQVYWNNVLKPNE